MYDAILDINLPSLFHVHVPLADVICAQLAGYACWKIVVTVYGCILLHSGSLLTNLQHTSRRF